MQNLLKSLCMLLVIYTIASAQPQAPDTLWTKTFGRSENDIGYSICVCEDGGFAITGSISISGQSLIWIMKTDDAGELIWENTHSTLNNGVGRSIKQTLDGGFIVAGNYGGFFSSYGTIIKFDSLGQFVWEQIYTPQEVCNAYSVIQSSDGNYIAVGYTSVESLYDSKVGTAKINIDGRRVWENKFSLNGHTFNYAYEVIQTIDGDILFCGGSGNPGSCTDGVIGELTSEGAVAWTSYTSSIYNDYFHNITESADGTLLCSGYTGYSAWLVRTTSQGGSVWVRTFEHGQGTFTFDHIVDHDQNVILAGNCNEFSTPSQAMLIGTDMFGNEEWFITIGGAENDEFNEIAFTTDDCVIAVGSTASYGAGGEDLWLVKFEEATANYLDASTDINSLAAAKSDLLTASPNPFNPSTTITYTLPISGKISLIVYDISGREIVTLFDGYREAGSYEAVFEGAELPSGVYFARLQAGGYNSVQKMLLVK